MGKNAILIAMTALALSGGQRSSAALIEISDDGVNTTFQWSGTFDPNGLTLFTPLSRSFFGLFPEWSSDSTFAGPTDMLFLDGLSTATIDIYQGFTVNATSGWTDPSGDSGTIVTTADSGGFYGASSVQFGGFTNGSGSFELPGTLSDNGFTLGESITFDNPGVPGPDGEIVFSTGTAAIPEPSALLFLTSIGLGVWFVVRRRRQLT